VRIAAVVVAFAIGLLAALIQVASSAVYGELAVAGSVPRALAGDWPLRAALRLRLDRVPALRAPLARAAIFRGDTALAQRLLATLSTGDPSVNDLRGRLALRSGDAAAALRWFAEAGDFVAARPAIDALAERNPREAYALIGRFDERLGGGASAEIGAEVLWREGQIAAAVAYSDPALSERYNRLALDAYRRALQRAPNEETYLLAYGYQALVIGDAAGAREAYRNAVRVVPDSIDAFVGLAAANATLGDCPAARIALARAGSLVNLSRYGPLIRRPIAHCLT
jgi:predicted Zn-dependent protease